MVSIRGSIPNIYFSYTELHFESGTFCVYPSRASVALISHSSIGNVVESTNGTGVFGSRAWIRIFIARHLDEQELVLTRLFGRDEDQFNCCELTRGRKPAEMNSRLSRYMVISICRRRLSPDISTTCMPRAL